MSFLLHRSFLFFYLSLFGFGFFLAPKVEAASLVISPATISVEEGQSVTLIVSVASPDQAMNAVSGTISFSKNILEVTSLSKTSSIVSLWVTEPSFSNSGGTASFEGVVLNPGFQGSSGRIFSLSFRAKAAGTATISFSSGSVLANDGQGTNISQSLGTATVSVVKKATGNEASIASTPDGNATPLAPEINSTTHPDPDGWYNSSDTTFTWQRLITETPSFQKILPLRIPCRKLPPPTFLSSHHDQTNHSHRSFCARRGGVLWVHQANL
jgi:hypothetical protein